MCIEALMQDGKALQAGTSHFLGQNFAKAFDCKFQSKDNQLEYVWATSWGMSTRLIGALIMAHSDDQGLVLPPRLAPTQIVIVPIYRKDDERDTVLEASNKLADDLRANGVRVKLDDREGIRPGWKFNEYEVQGVPLRVAIGPRDIANGTVEVAYRHSGNKETRSIDSLATDAPALLETIQQSLFDNALAFRAANTTSVDSYDEFKRVIDEKGGFVLAHWDGSAETETRIKEETKATIRCIPLDAPAESGSDLISGKPSERRVVFAKAY
jgi:prolyl-tRNA synthetase